MKIAFVRRPYEGGLFGYKTYRRKIGRPILIQKSDTNTLNSAKVCKVLVNICENRDNDLSKRGSSARCVHINKSCNIYTG